MRGWREKENRVLGKPHHPDRGGGLAIEKNPALPQKIERRKKHKEAMCR